MMAIHAIGAARQNQLGVLLFGSMATAAIEMIVDGVGKFLDPLHLSDRNGPGHFHDRGMAARTVRTVDFPNVRLVAVLAVDEHLWIEAMEDRLGPGARMAIGRAADGSPIFLRSPDVRMMADGAGELVRILEELARKNVASHAFTHCATGGALV
jgi:hypothetical protein